MEKTVLILGSRGRFGRHTTRAFKNAGWTVRQFDRNSDSLWDAAWGASVIVNGWNVAIEKWKTEMLPLHAKVVEVAAASGATVILPSNIYLYGSTMPRVLGPDTAHAADRFYGTLRVEIEESYRAAGVHTIALRSGDYLDDQASGNWFDKVLVDKLPKGRLVYPGPLDRAHAWAYLPDLARVAVGLAEMREELPGFTDVPYAGLTLTGQEMADILSNLRNTPVRATRMPWLPLIALSPFWAMAQYLVAMRYLWNVPHEMDGSVLRRLLPDHRDSDALTALAAATQHHVRPDEPMARDPLVVR